MATFLQSTSLRKIDINTINVYSKSANGEQENNKMVLDDVDFKTIMCELKRFGRQFSIDFTGQPVKLTENSIEPLDEGFVLPFPIYRILRDAGLIKLELNEDDILTQVTIL